MLIDKQIDLEQKEEWEESKETWEMTTDEFIALCAKGFSNCSGFCSSREICGEDSCYCVRAYFANPTCYQLYLTYREFYLENLNQKLATDVAKGGEYYSLMENEDVTKKSNY